MKQTAAILAVGTLLAIGTPVFGQDNDKATGKIEIIQTNSRGQATQVRIDGKVYDVCMSDAQDSCINPRAAGLNWGNRPLAYWPGKPASES